MVALFSTCCCVNLCIHLCSGGKLLSYLVNILTQDVIKNEWLFFSPFFATYCCVNSWINLFSGGKLLSYLVNILTQDTWLRMNCCSFLHLLLYELVHSLVLSWWVAFNILTQDVWLRMNGCSFLYLLLCELVYSR